MKKYQNKRRLSKTELKIKSLDNAIIKLNHKIIILKKNGKKKIEDLSIRSVATWF